MGARVRADLPSRGGEIGELGPRGAPKLVPPGRIRPLADPIPIPQSLPVRIRRDEDGCRDAQLVQDREGALIHRPIGVVECDGEDGIDAACRHGERERGPAVAAGEQNPTIRLAAEEGAGTYDMLLGDEGFKLRYATRVEEAVSVALARRWSSVRLRALAKSRAQACMAGTASRRAKQDPALIAATGPARFDRPTRRG